MRFLVVKFEMFFFSQRFNIINRVEISGDTVSFKWTMELLKLSKSADFSLFWVNCGIMKNPGVGIEETEAEEVWSNLVIFER